MTMYKVVMPEGRQELKVLITSFDDVDKKVYINVENCDGVQDTIFLRMERINGRYNMKAVKLVLEIFRACLKDKYMDSFNTEDLPKLVGKKFIAEVMHMKSINKAGCYYTKNTYFNIEESEC